MTSVSDRLVVRDDVGRIAFLCTVPLAVFGLIACRSFCAGPPSADVRLVDRPDTVIARAHPDGVSFTVGEHTPRDLPFLLAVTQNTDLSWRLPEWRIVFDYEGARQGTATLRLGIAGSEGRARLKVMLNARTLAVVGGLVHDGSAHRGGVRGVYQQRRVRFDAGRLQPGRNVLTLGLREPGRPVARRLGYPRAAVLLDCLRLEVPDG